MEHKLRIPWRPTRGVIALLLALLLVALAPRNATLLVPLGYATVALLCIFMSMWRRWGFFEMVGWWLLLLPVIERILRLQ